MDIANLKATVSVDGKDMPRDLRFEAHGSWDPDEVATEAIIACGVVVMDACSKPFRLVEHPVGVLVSGRVAVRIETTAKHR